MKLHKRDCYERCHAFKGILGKLIHFAKSIFTNISLQVIILNSVELDKNEHIPFLRDNSNLCPGIVSRSLVNDNFHQENFGTVEFYRTFIRMRRDFHSGIFLSMKKLLQRLLHTVLYVAIITIVPSYASTVGKAYAFCELTLTIETKSEDESHQYCLLHYLIVNLISQHFVQTILNLTCTYF